MDSPWPTSLHFLKGTTPINFSIPEFVRHVPMLHVMACFTSEPTFRKTVYKLFQAHPPATKVDLQTSFDFTRTLCAYIQFHRPPFSNLDECFQHWQWYSGLLLVSCSRQSMCRPFNTILKTYKHLTGWMKMLHSSHFQRTFLELRSDLQQFEVMAFRSNDATLMATIRHGQQCLDNDQALRKFADKRYKYIVYCPELTHYLAQIQQQINFIQKYCKHSFWEAPEQEWILTPDPTSPPPSPPPSPVMSPIPTNPLTLMTYALRVLPPPHHIEENDFDPTDEPAIYRNPVCPARYSKNSPWSNQVVNDVPSGSRHQQLQERFYACYCENL